jgi:hypothetical protein
MLKNCKKIELLNIVYKDEIGLNFKIINQDKIY